MKIFKKKCKECERWKERFEEMEQEVNESLEDFMNQLRQTFIDRCECNTSSCAYCILKKEIFGENG